MKGNVWIPTKISLKFVPKGPINNIFQHWFREWLGAVQATSHYLNQWWLVYWRIYASLGLNELTHWGLDEMAYILQMTFRNAFCEMKSIILCFKFHFKSASVQGLVLCRTGDTALPERMMTIFYETLRHHLEFLQKWVASHGWNPSICTQQMSKYSATLSKWRCFKRTYLWEESLQSSLFTNCLMYPCPCYYIDSLAQKGDPIVFCSAIDTLHWSDVIMGTMVSQITGLTIVYSTVYSGADQRKHQSSASLAFVRGIHRWPVNSQHKGQ